MAKTMLPVHDLDTEAMVLSVLLLDPERIASVESVLTPSDFYSVANQKIARAIWDLDAAGETVDITSVGFRLRSREELEQIGGTPYLAQIQGDTPAVAHVVDHARVVASLARVRRVQAVCHQIAAEAYTVRDNAADWLQDVERRVFEATDAASMREDTVTIVQDAIPAELAAIKLRAERKRLPGRSTRIRALDRILYGLVDGVPYVLAGRPGHGKTAACWQIVEGVAKGGALAVMLSQEMPRPQLMQRAIAQGANVEVRSIQTGQLSSDDWASVANSVRVVESLPIAVDDRSGHTVHSVRSTVRRCVQKLRARGHKGPLGIIALDYLQIMASSTASRKDGRATEVADNMHGLTAIAKEFRCPVLILSQLNRAIETRPDKRPKLSDLGESGAIEADGYGIMFVYRNDVYRPEEERDGMAEIIVAKNRNGRTGTASLRYMPSTLFALHLDHERQYEKEDEGVNYDEFDNFADDYNAQQVAE